MAALLAACWAGTVRWGRQHVPLCLLYCLKCPAQADERCKLADSMVLGVTAPSYALSAGRCSPWQSEALSSTLSCTVLCWSACCPACQLGAVQDLVAVWRCMCAPTSPFLAGHWLAEWQERGAAGEVHFRVPWFQEQPGQHLHRHQAGPLPLARHDQAVRGSLQVGSAVRTSRQLCGVAAIGFHLDPGK